MAVIEQQLADQLIAARLAESTGTLYWPIGEYIAALQLHLEREQWHRQQRGRLAELVEAVSGDRAVNAAEGGR